MVTHNLSANNPESLQQDPLAHANSEAASHLRVALSQAIPSDDQIILEHVRDALRILEAARG